MQFIKQLEYTPIRQFILRHKVKDGVVEAFVCERARIRTQVAQVSKKEYAQIMHVVEDPSTLQGGKIVLNREKLVNLATIYFLETEGEPLVFDIHYHTDGHRNGIRTKEEVKTDVLAILKNAGYKVGLSVGAFMCHKVSKHNKQGHQVIKRYEKVK